ncbi:MAG TPA: hypothetical protein VFA20_07260 [Myxococcaceae bacterium]|nr:hypothetical protein [Myxococcaceae bacterium]
MKTKVMAATAGLLACASLACTQYLNVRPRAPAADLTISPTELSKPVQRAFQGLQDGSAARDAERQKSFEAQKAQMGPSAQGFYDAAKASGVDVAGFLQASKDFVQSTDPKARAAMVSAVNQKYAGPIKAAIAKAVSVPGAGDLLQQAQSPAATGSPPPPPPSPAGGNGCCVTNRFAPPWEGEYDESDFGARAIRPGPTAQLAVSAGSAIAFGPHRLAASGHRFTVAFADPSSELVTVTLPTQWVIGLSGVGYAHVWLGLEMWVTTLDGTEVCRATRLEQDNEWTWAGGWLTQWDHRPGPTVTRSCRFDRAAGAPTEYVVNVSASVDGTFVGFSGGFGNYFVDLGNVDVASCPW